MRNLIGRHSSVGRRIGAICGASIFVLSWATLAEARSPQGTTPQPDDALDRTPVTPTSPSNRAENAAAAIGRCQQGATKAAKPEEGEVLFQAETLAYDAKSDTVTADGKVEAAFWGCVLTADHVEYEVTANVVRASGDIAIMEPSGNVVFAKSLDLSGGLEQGIVSSFSAVLAGNTHIAALSAERKAAKVTELRHVVYSPCKVCNKPGFEPLWQIKAVRVIHDENRKTIRYRSAVLEVKGVPVFYLPYFEHADPSVKRKTGFLIPSVGSSSDLGSYAEIPYYLTIGPNQDVTLSPMLTSGAANVMMGEYRLRTHAGQMRLSGSFAQDTIASTDPLVPADTTWRSHFFGDGRFRFSDVWSYGFNAQITSDDTYLKRYQISDLDRLRTQIYAEGVAGRDYASLESFYFQGLRATDDPGRTPIVLPLGEVIWYPTRRILGGQFKVEANILSISRSEGPDSNRISMSGEWRREAVTDTGHMFSAFALLRGDGYYTRDLNPTKDPTLPRDKGFTGRVVPLIGGEWHWPLARASGSYFHIIEPIAQVILSTYGGNPREIPNEDSASFEFDDTNLFSTNKLPGYDVIESGPRANVGLHYALNGPHGNAVDILVGENLRLKEQTLFNGQSGLGDQQSDYVGRVRVTPSKYFEFVHRFRIDHQDLSFSRNEFTGRVGTSDYWARLSYVQLSQELSASGLVPRKEVSGTGRVKLWTNWYLEAAARRDLIRDKMISSGAALVFSNECAEIALQFKRRFTRDRELAPSSAFTVRIRLKTFGESSTP